MGAGGVTQPSSGKKGKPQENGGEGGGGGRGKKTLMFLPLE